MIKIAKSDIRCKYILTCEIVTVVKLLCNSNCASFSWEFGQVAVRALSLGLHLMPFSYQQIPGFRAGLKTYNFFDFTVLPIGELNMLRAQFQYSA